MSGKEDSNLINIMEEIAISTPDLPTPPPDSTTATDREQSPPMITNDENSDQSINTASNHRINSKSSSASSSSTIVHDRPQSQSQSQVQVVQNVSTPIKKAKLPTPLQQVTMSAEAFRFCMSQCLSTEVEEVMGLLIGHVDIENGHCYITQSLPLKRLDKRKDRVEIGTEQLASSFGIVEELIKRRRDADETRDQQQSATSINNGDNIVVNNGDHDYSDQQQQQQKSSIAYGQEDLSVVGWYHSHPHITVFPSEVDITTHNQYQSSLSPHWIGLIFGVFNYDETKCENKFQLIAFQSIQVQGQRLKHGLVPIVVEPRPWPLRLDEWSVEKVSHLIDLLLDEEKEALKLHQGGAGEIDGDQGGDGGDRIVRHYNSCVYSKAVSKIITLLGGPILDILGAIKESSEEVEKV